MQGGGSSPGLAFFAAPCPFQAASGQDAHRTKGFVSAFVQCIAALHRFEAVFKCHCPNPYVLMGWWFFLPLTLLST